MSDAKKVTEEVNKEKVIGGADSYNPAKGKETEDKKIITSSIKIGDKEFEISKFNLNDMIAIEEKLGALTKIGEKIGNIRFILWYAIHKKYESITEEEVGEMIVASDIPKVTEKLLKIADITGNPTVTPKR